MKAGIRSPNFLKLVIEGKRNLTAATIEKFIKALDLKSREQAFFRHLVFFNQAVTAEEKQEHYAVLLSMMDSVPHKKLTVDQHQFYNKWYIPVLRELVCIQNFGDDYEMLAKAVVPPITPAQARKGVQLLCRLALIEKTSSGDYHQTNTAIASDSALSRMAVRNFNRAMIMRAHDAIDAMDPSQRHISGITCGVSEACYRILETEILAFKERIASIVNKDQATQRVYQLNIQLFPVSRDFSKPDKGKCEDV